MASSPKKEHFEELVESMAVEEVERILALSRSVENTLQDSEACKLLRCFMESANKSLQCLDIHEKCAEFLAEKHPTYDSFVLDILARLGLAPHLKQSLAYRLENSDSISISLCLKNIMRSCRDEIEEFFTDYEDSITKKLTNLKLGPQK
ncbi:uncharacterized protein LOC119560166 [Drosophila subpulchrella]|uniref:uncharacterized protein LOC119560166 n=1 Tax=Drosophila subpulchrella TaxID=1486046 RepID=UPI0018A1B2B6|nr:uncharacterized protein LOC119560166 [Drosophila subpulchrella]